MKKLLLLVLVLNFGFFTFSQTILSGKMYSVPENLKNISLKQPIHNTIDNPMNLLGDPNPYISSKDGKDVTDSVIGTTKYDLQSNTSMQNRIFLYDDGTIGATWTYGTSYTNGFPERGTGYNYFNDTAWGPDPTVRIESIRSGWPSIAPLGTGEIVVSHNVTVANVSTGLQISTRPNRGTGTWRDTTYLGPVNSNTTTGMQWPRMVTSGANDSTVHIIACTEQGTAEEPITYAGLNLALVYSRSTDGGQTWDKNNVILPGMTSSEYKGFNGDTYAWAEPKGDTIAFVVGDSWTDVFVMRSEDGGDNWTKQLVYQHPYPMWTDSIETSNIFVCDGSMSIALDNTPEHHAHVAFGRMEVINDSIGDASTKYYPYTTGLIYWNDTMPTLTTDSLDDANLVNLLENGKLIAWNLDLNADDSINYNVLPNNEIAFGKYWLSTTSMPNVVVDEQNNIFVVYSAVVEASQPEYYYEDLRQYRHLFAREYNVDSARWSNFEHLTKSPSYYYSENVFPSVAANSDSYLHLIFQADLIPGTAIRKEEGDVHAYVDNSIMYMKVPKSDFEFSGSGDGIKENYVANHISIYPNPSTDNIYLSIILNNTSDVNLKISNFMGQTIYEKHEGKLPKGVHVLHTDVSSLSSGIYLLTVQAENRITTEKIVIQ